MLAQTPIALNFSGTEVTITTGTATGALSPFGNASLSVSGTPTGDTTGNVALVFTFTDGDTLKGTGPATIGQSVVNGTATINGGTGAFANATGSFNWTINVDLSTDPNPFTLTGSGTLTGGPATSSFPVACDGGGSSLPIVEHPAPAASGAGPVCAVVVCGDGAGSSLPILEHPAPQDGVPAQACVLTGMVDFDGGGSSLPILVFDGSGGTLPLFAETGSGSSLPILWPGNGNGTTTPVIVTFEGAGSSLPVVEQPAPRQAAGSASRFAIFTPVESSSTTYSAAAACPGLSGPCWLTLPAPSGNIAAGSRAGIPVSIDRGTLAPGMYYANVAITIGGTVTNRQVGLLVAPAAPMMTLSTAGLRFTAVAGAPAPPAQTVGVINGNTAGGSLSFTTAVSSGGANWLAVSGGTGTAPAVVTVQVNPAGLAPGSYSGRVDFTPAGSVNAPQSVEVALTVLATTANPGPTLSATGLVFVSAKSSPAAQTITVSNLSNQPLTISTQSAFANGSGWLTASASGATASASGATAIAGQPVKLTVTVNPTGLANGIYLGTLDIHAAETNSDVPVEIVLVVAGAGSCTPSALMPVLTDLEGNFQRTAGFPVPVQALVADNCGNMVSTGSVQAYFNGSDIPVTLASMGGGVWAGSWLPRTLAGGPASVGILAASGGLFGSNGTTGTLVANNAAPIIASGGAVSAASFAPGSRIAPGEFLSIFGSNLASGVAQAKSFPYLPLLGGTQVFLGGEAMPLEVTAAGQINAVVPYDAPLNTPLSMVVEAGGVSSLPEPVIVTAAEPAVFTQDQSGQGAGAIDVIRPDGTGFLNTAAQPAAAGDVLVIYGTGFGAVTPAVASGAAAPSTNYTYTAATVTATVGGQAAQVRFAGLAPGFASLYQVNVVVPQGVTPGPAVPVLLAAAGQTSPPVTAAIRGR